MSDFIFDQQENQNVSIEEHATVITKAQVTTLKIILCCLVYAALITMSFYHEKLFLTELLTSGVIIGLVGFVSSRSRMER